MNRSVAHASTPDDDDETNTPLPPSLAGNTMRQMSMTEARRNLHLLPKVVEEGPLTLTKQGKPAMVLMGYDEYESLMEMLDILSDSAFSRELTRSIQQIHEGKTRLSKEVRKRLGIRA